MSDCGDQSSQNFSMLQQGRFRFSTRRAPNIHFLMQSFHIPSISLPEAVQPTPFTNIRQPGDHLSFDPLVIGYRVNGNMSNYLEIFHWMKELGFPDNHMQYAPLSNVASGLEAIRGKWSEGLVEILTENDEVAGSFVFHDIWPTNLTIDPLITQIAQVEYINSIATFNYRSFDYLQLNN